MRTVATDGILWMSLAGNLVLLSMVIHGRWRTRNGLAYLTTDRAAEEIEQQILAQLGMHHGLLDQAVADLELLHGQLYGADSHTCRACRATIPVLEELSSKLESWIEP